MTKDLICGVFPDANSTATFVRGPDHSAHQRKAAKEKGEELKPSFMGSVLSYLD
ncbi:MAG TPA: hypothetical protein VLB50_07810 [Ignavibacteriaceae bacterium]|nr:hypothetical protein [Ignavibacteriaceae bacterium]